MSELISKKGKLGRTADPNQPLGWSTRIAYGLGDTACNILFGMISALITLFYTDYAGVSITIVGLVMLVSRIFDGISDLIMGVIVAKTKSRWGKCRPWLLWMSVPFALSAVAMFFVPQSTESVQFWYMFVTYNLCTTVAYTAINVPYGTLSTYMTRSSRERDVLSSIRMALSPVGKILSVSCTLPLVKLFGDDQAAWIKTMSIWSVLAIVMLVICFVKCKETVVLPEAAEGKQKKIPVGRQIKALLGNPYFWATLLLWTITCVHVTLIGIDLPYYCKYILGNDSLYSAVYLAEVIMLIIGALLSPVLLKYMNKRNLSLIGCVIAVVAQLAFVFGPDTYAWLMITTIVRSLGEAPLVAVVFGMMGDVVEYGQWKTGIRQASLVFGAGSMGFKLGVGATGAAISGLLHAAGYISSTAGQTVVQPDSAKSMIVQLYNWGPVIFWGLAIVILLFYKLDHIYPQIMEDLAKREAKGEL